MIVAGKFDERSDYDEDEGDEASMEDDGEKQKLESSLPRHKMFGERAI